MEMKPEFSAIGVTSSLGPILYSVGPISDSIMFLLAKVCFSTFMILNRVRPYL